MTDYISTAEAAEIIGCTDGRVRQLVRGDKIPGVVRMGERVVLIPKVEAEKLAKTISHVGRPRNKNVG